jgi:hypothetical protein
LESLLGFELDIWDYATFVAVVILVAAAVVAVVFMLGLPGRIAVARHHPEAEAVSMMGWLGFVAVVPWVQAFIWAFKPTNVVDIRYLPKDVQRDTNEQIAKLTGKPPPVAAGKEAPPPADLQFLKPDQ